MEIENVPRSEVIPYSKNPRKNDKAVDVVAKSIKEYGFKVPIILDRNNVIVAGHTRLKAAEKLGLMEVPVLWADDLTDEQIRAFRIMENKSSEYATWNIDLLKTEMQELKNANFKLDLTGFSEVELDKLVPLEMKEGEIPDVSKPKYDVKTGDIWQLGNHRLLCGDSTNVEAVQGFMSHIRGQMTFTDPPYNVNYGSVKNHPSWKRTQKDDSPNEFISNDNLSDDEWSKFVTKYMKILLEYSDGPYYVCMSNKEMYSNKHIFEESGGHWASFIIWDKNRFVLGLQDYQRQYEPIMYGWKEGKQHYWCGDRTQSDVWQVDRPSVSIEHPTMKPIELCKRAILNSSKEGDIVLDFFGGSGSTMMACEQTNRICYMVELDPKYASVIIERFENLTGKKGVKL